jgi:hypothetical protein
MKKLLLLILCVPALALGQNFNMTADTKFHKVRKSPTSPSQAADLDFSDVIVIGLGGSGVGTVTSITATAPIVVTPSPLVSTGVISINPAAFEVPLTFSQSVTRAVNTVTLTNDSATPGNSKYYGTNSGGTRGYFSLPVAAAQTFSVTLVVDGSGSVMSSGTKNPIKIPYGGTLTGWLLIGSPSGSVTVDIFRAANGAGLPVTSIVGAGTKPSLSSAVENSSTNFTSWTSTTLTAKDNLAISLSGITTSTYCALTLYFQ